MSEGLTTPVVCLIILDTRNADFDGDVINTMIETLPELHDMFAGFSPLNMIIDRVDGKIRYTVSDLESITIAMFSDR